MRVLIICKKLNDGGAERVCASWANGIVKLGHDADILTNLKLPVTYTTVPEVGLIQLSRFRIRSKFIRNIFGWVPSLLQLRALIQERKYDAIIDILHREMTATRLATWLSVPRIPVIISDHNPCERPACMPMPAEKRIKKFILSRLFDHITVLTNQDKKIMLEHGIQKVSVLHNPLFLTPSTEEFPRSKTVLAAGRLEDWYGKGFDLLIHAWNTVGKNHPDWKLRIIGSGSDKIRKQLYAMSDNPSGIEIMDYTSDIARQYREASVFCLSSRFEGWGLVLTEAMSQGCATIACDFRGRQAEFIHDGENGLLCPTENVGALTEKLELLISDETIRTRLQKAAPYGLEEFSETNVARNLVNLIKTLNKSAPVFSR